MSIEAYDWDIERCRAYAKQLRDKTRANTAEHAAQAIEWLLAQLASHQIIGKNQEPKPAYGIRGGLAHDAGSVSYVLWDNTKCNPLAPAREQARSAWEDGYASAKHEWVGLTDEEIDQGLLRSDYALQTAHAWRAGVVFAMTQLKEKNHG